MNRRQMVALPAVALAAGGISQTVAQSTSTATISHKAIARYGRLKALYTVPKTEAKRTKYVNFLTTLLTLTSDQATQATAIFAAAATSTAALRQQIKISRQSLTTAVRGLDSASISAKSRDIGSLSAQKHLIGAQAHSAFFQLLTAQQQSTLSQFGLTRNPNSA